MMPPEITLVAIVRARAGHEEAVAGILAAVVPPSQAEPGCRLYTLHRDQSDPRRFVFIERWADQAALAEHEQTAHFLRLGQLLPPHVEGESEIMRLDSLA